MFRVTYGSNNSGGDWWLTDEDWYNLEKAGWVVLWEKNISGQERFLGALARSAYLEKEDLTLRSAVYNWEEVTGKSSESVGCPCCGQPHSFSLEKDGKYIKSGPTLNYGMSW